MTAPQPAPAAADARGVVVDAAALEALGEIRAVADTLGVCGSGTGATKMRQMATALRAACDALASATPAVPGVDRAAFEAAVTEFQWEVQRYENAIAHAKPTADLWPRVAAARAALLALVFPDAPAHDADAAGDGGAR